MFTFDYNGNILTQQRYEGSTLVDNLSYQYATNSAGDLLSNRLYSVDDAVTVASLSATDMEDMPLYNNTTPNTSNNYKYTQIGELKSDNQEEIQEIVWRVDSKISEIVRTSGSVKKNLKFEYDAMGNRVAKHVYAGSVLESSTYYVRDAQGNVMGVYEHKMDAENAVMEYKLIERNIYGSAQVGICKDTVDLNITNSSGALTQATYYHARQLNHRQYSLSNHLGNVLTTIGDGKAPVDSNSDGVIDYFTAYIISVSDYSPFGVELASRTWSIEEYRSGFQGQEYDNELKGKGNHVNFTHRGYDPRICTMWSIDPLSYKFPYYSPYHFASNTPVIAKDLEGLQSSVQLNYNETSVTITRDDKNRFFVTTEQSNQIPSDKIRQSTGSWVIQDLTPGGKGWEVYCPDCWTPYGKGGYVNITIPKMKVTRSEEVKTPHNTTNEERGRIGCTYSVRGTLVDVADYNDKLVTPITDFAVVSIGRGVTGLKDGEKLTGINVQVNSTLGEEYRSNIETQLKGIYGDDININVTLQKGMASTTAVLGDLDYETTEIVTKEVIPVIITP